MYSLVSRLRRLLPGACLVAALAAGPPPAGAASFPLAIHAADGTVNISARPTRIISLSPSATQDLYAVGAGGQVVAVDAYSTYPAGAPRTSLSEYTPNVEAMARYRPDLVVLADDIDGDVAQLRKLGIPVLLEPPAADLGEAYAEIEQIARATGHTRAAAALVARMRRQVAAIVHSVPRPHPPLTVYHELDQAYDSATSHSFIGQMYVLLGLRNIADKVGGSNPYPQLSDEYIVASDPDLIVLADTVCCGQNAKTVAARPGWNTIAAVKDGGVVAVSDSVASQWGPRIVLFLRAVAGAVIRLERRDR